MRKLLILFILCIVATTVTADGYKIEPLEKFYELVNEERRRSGLDPLEPSDKLENVASFYSGVCARNKGVSHDFATDEEVYTVVAYYDALKFNALGEVLQMGPIQNMGYMDFVTYNFMASPDHARILLGEGDRIGASYTISGKMMYFAAYVGRY